MHILHDVTRSRSDSSGFFIKGRRPTGRRHFVVSAMHTTCPPDSLHFLAKLMCVCTCVCMLVCFEFADLFSGGHCCLHDGMTVRIERSVRAGLHLPLLSFEKSQNPLRDSTSTCQLLQAPATAEKRPATGLESFVKFGV